MKQLLAERFWSKVRIGPGCWEWTASRWRNGYGQFGMKGTMRAAHRVAYELSIGPIPEDLEIDHLCRNRGCMNPAHMEPVPHSVNLARSSVAEVTRARHAAQTHCKHGHLYDDANTAINRGRRACRACDRDRATARRARTVA